MDPPAVVEEPATPETNAVEEEPENEPNGDAPSAPEGDFYYTSSYLKDFLLNNSSMKRGIIHKIKLHSEQFSSDFCPKNCYC